MEESKIKEVSIRTKVDSSEIDETIEKANHLKSLLLEVKEIIDSL